MPSTIEVDASQKGLGAALLLDGYPVTFASKALMPKEYCYTNAEHELLICIFGEEQFYTSLTMHLPLSNHKPLEQTKLRNLANALVCLQRMLINLQNCDVTIKYQPGKQMSSPTKNHWMLKRYLLTLP